ncbi:MAG TPA: NADP-dependent oxidoreductase [Steroidobacteraceae bacterium]|nr:NADP-dependent oxidoreductase [Steroidobacteraceae bacterium]
MSHSLSSRRVVLARRPCGVPRAADFRLEAATTPELAAAEVRVANRFLSMDPAIRGFLDDRPSYLPPVAIGATVRGMTLGRVVESRNPRIPAGAYVRALAGWEELSVLDSQAIGLEVIEPAAGIPLENYLGALGPAGLTAWIGLNEIGRLSPGQTVLLSAAAGAVGSVAGQIARLRGCRVVGLVGSSAKAERLRSLGFHAAVDYRASADLGQAIRTACPDGVDLYFDNVGGAILEAVLPQMKVHGFVVVCGMVGDYNTQDDPQPVRTLWQLVVKRLTMRGFLTYEHAHRIPEAQAQLTQWVREGALVALDNFHDGLEQAPAAFIELMSGLTIGKTLVRLPER